MLVRNNGADVGGKDVLPGAAAGLTTVGKRVAFPEPGPTSSPGLGRAI